MLCLQRDAAPCTSRRWAGGIRTCAAPTVLCLPNMRQPLPYFFKQMPLFTLTDRRNQALYSTPARTQISLSFSIHAPHIMGSWRYALGSHLQSSTHRIRDSRFHTFQTDAAPHTDRPSQPSRLLDLCTDTNQPQVAESWAAGIRTGTSPSVLCLPDAPQLMPHGALSHGNAGCALADRRRAGSVRRLAPRPRAPAASRVQRLPPATDGGRRGPRER